eukprot:m.135610 g.135610  ORF g.135610 m.135610 type:complete len:186 (-) comp17557_c0_seq5:408-965(-)
MPPPPVRGAYFAIMGRSTAPIELQAYLDYACPFCAKIFKTLYQEVIPHYGDNIQFVFKHQVQPWHPQSALMHEAGLAVKQIADTETFFKFSEKLFADQTQFFDANVWNKSRDTITKELIQLAVEISQSNMERFGPRHKRNRACPAGDFLQPYQTSIWISGHLCAGCTDDSSTTFCTGTAFTCMPL